MEIWPTTLPPSSNLILQADIDAYLLILITKGYFNSTTKNTSTLLNVGDLILINTSQVNSSISAGESMSLYIPRTELEQHMGHYRIPNEVILKAKQPMTQLLTDYMLSLFNVALDLNPEKVILLLKPCCHCWRSGSKMERCPSIRKSIRF